MNRSSIGLLSAVAMSLLLACGSDGAAETGSASSAKPGAATAATTQPPSAASTAVSAPAPAPPTPPKPGSIKFARVPDVVGERCTIKTSEVVDGVGPRGSLKRTLRSHLELEALEVKEGKTIKSRVTYRDLLDPEPAPKSGLIGKPWVVSHVDDQTSVVDASGAEAPADVKTWFTTDRSSGSRQSTHSALDGVTVVPGEEVPELANVIVGEPPVEATARRVMSRTITFKGLEKTRARFEFEVEIELDTKAFKAKGTEKGWLLVSVPDGNLVKIEASSLYDLEGVRKATLKSTRKGEALCTKP